MHGFGMAAVNNDDSIVLYGKSIANFSAAYAATPEPVKSHSLMIASMQGQLQAMQQFCMALQQQQPPHHLSIPAATAWPSWFVAP
jgi:hypothetical protein